MPTPLESICCEITAVSLTLGRRRAWLRASYSESVYQRVRCGSIYGDANKVIDCTTELLPLCQNQCSVRYAGPFRVVVPVSLIVGQILRAMKTAVVPDLQTRTHVLYRMC